MINGAALRNEFIRAILKGNEQLAISMLDNIGDLNFRVNLQAPKQHGFQSGTPLHFAIIKELFELAEKIACAENVNLFLKDNLGRTALHLSTIKNNIALSKKLSYKSPTLHMAKDTQGNTSVHIAATKPDISHLHLFLSLPNSDPDFSIKDINSVNNHLQSPLHLAATSGNEQAVDLLLTHDANPKLIDRDGYTASQLAFVKYPHISEKMKVGVPSLLATSAIAMEHNPELMTFVQNASCFPSDLYQRVTELVQSEKDYQNARKASEIELIEQRKQVVDELAKKDRMTHS